MDDCRTGKDFNPITCRFIKSCRPGYGRDKDFKCVKGVKNSFKPRTGKEKIGLLKELFSNSSESSGSSGSSNSNGLYNSPPVKARSKSKKLGLKSFGPILGSKIDKGSSKKSKYPSKMYNSEGNEIPNIEPIPRTINIPNKKRMTQFIESIGPGIVKMDSHETMALARSEGIELGNVRQKYLFRKSLLDYISKLEPKKSKKVKFLSPKSKLGSKTAKSKVPVNENGQVNGLSPKPSNAKSKSAKAKSAKSKPKPSKSANAKLSKSKPKSKPKTPKPKPVTLKKQDKINLINAFLEKMGYEISKIPWGEVKRLARENGITLNTEAYKTLFRKVANDYLETFESMTIKIALKIMDLDENYTMDQLADKYREKSLLIHPDKSFEKKKTTSEFQRLQKAFDLLKERLDNNDFEPHSISFPSSSIINGIDERTDELSNATTFVFYSKSTDKPPGKGSGEKLAPGDEGNYDALSKIKDWRKKLSNFWIQPFDLEGKRWQSVEHYYQASKFKEIPDFYNEFALDSGTQLSTDPVMAKAAGGKTGKFKGHIIRPKEFKLDNGFFEERSKIEMFKAQHAKFTQHKDLLQLLKLTKQAKLVHYERGGPPVVFNNLMFIRSKI